MKLDPNALKLISIFTAAGCSAYAVGGCVRDSIMGRPCNDTDIAVSCTPDVTVAILKKADIRCVETGLKHGTVTAVIDCRPYEITTFRTEGAYTDNRHPDTVAFVTDIGDDLSRRDFTVNAMAYSQEGGVVDLFGGVEDINNKIIRTVGDPDCRFGEDALRILRALRFASVLGFNIDKATSDSIIRNKQLLLNVARERITAEMQKLLCGDGTDTVLRDYFAVFNTLFNKKFEKQAYDLASKHIAQLPRDFCVRYAFLCLCLIGAFDEQKYTFLSPLPEYSELVGDLFGALVLTNSQKKRLSGIFLLCNCQLEAEISCACRAMYNFGETAVCDIAALAKNHDVLLLVDRIKKEDIPYQLSHLDINGRDLIPLGYAGAQIKSALQMLLFAVIDGSVDNEKQKLIDYIVKKH